MMLVDNFKVILLVVLICAAGLQSTEALKCKGPDVTCEDGKWCSVDQGGKQGCDATAECEPTNEMYCCGTDYCNGGQEMCLKSPKIIQCEQVKKELQTKCKTDPEAEKCKEWKKFLDRAAKTTGEAAETTGGAAGTYGGISIVTLVSAFLYYIPLNLFL